MPIDFESVLEELSSVLWDAGIDTERASSPDSVETAPRGSTPLTADP